MKIAIDTEITEQTASDFALAVQDLADNEELTIEICSEGGSVTAGNVIVSKIRELSNSGHKTTAHVISLAASMASVIACACDNLIMDSNALMMIHAVWSCVQGNADQLRKEADTLDLFTRSLIAVYRSKFNRTDEEIMAMLQAETWILAEQAELYGLRCEINNVGSEIRIAASIDLSKFKNLPKVLSMEIEEKKPEEIENVENIEKALDETAATLTTDNTEEKKPTYEELEERIKELESKLAEYEEDDDDEDDDEETVSKAECEKRVSGMQSKMQAKINDFINQLKVRDEELAKMQVEATSLRNELDKATRELQETASALEDKNNALAQLNAGVNAQPVESKPSGWGSLEGNDFFDYLKRNHGILKIKNK